MSKITDNKIFYLLLFLTIIGEFLLPWILKHFYEGYSSKRMVMSVLGSPGSPVRFYYNIWMVWLGLFLVYTAVIFYNNTKKTSSILAILIFVSILVFAIGAGVLSGLFSVNETKEIQTVASMIHGVGAAIGFMMLLFFPLLSGIVAVKQEDAVGGIINIIAFVLGVLFFTFFIMGDKEQFKDTFISYEGLWERLALFAMYIPFIYKSVTKLLR